jgi:UDP-glucose 4-epimerase
VRVLITGIGTFWGSRIAQELEKRPDVDVVVGLGTEEPILPLERTEFVRADSSYSILHRLVHATQVDTIVHTHLNVDSTQQSGRAMHEVNVIGTMNLLAAAGTADSPVRKVVVKSSTLVYGANFEDPYFFREDTPRSKGPRTRVERSLIEVEGFVSDFAEDSPHVTVTMLRFSNVLGEHMQTPFAKTLRLPVVPEVFGFDPRLQFTTSTTRAARSCTQPSRRCRASTTSPAMAPCRGARCARSWASAGSRCRRC